jgi:hypothetical protein
MENWSSLQNKQGDQIGLKKIAQNIFCHNLYMINT